jgi:hypothetical protein
MGLHRSENALRGDLIERRTRGARVCVHSSGFDRRNGCALGLGVRPNPVLACGAFGFEVIASPTNGAFAPYTYGATRTFSDEIFQAALTLRYRSVLPPDVSIQIQTRTVQKIVIFFISH